MNEGILGLFWGTVIQIDTDGTVPYSQLPSPNSRVLDTKVPR